VRLIDFGVASLTGAGESGGKYAYAAPEQLLEDVTSPLSDQYSLGVVLWECLTGRSAFDADEDVEIIRRVTEEGIEALPDAVPEDLRTTVAKMCALHPGERFADLNEVRDSLSRGERVRGAGVRGATVTSPAVERRFTVEQAEAIYGREVVDEMVASGELRAEDVNGARVFVKPA
jgi:serine/threonine-protein kinase